MYDIKNSFLILEISLNKENIFDFKVEGKSNFFVLEWYDVISPFSTSPYASSPQSVCHSQSAI